MSAFEISRTGYILDVFSEDIRGGNIITFCCLDNEGYFEAIFPNKRILFFVEQKAVFPVPAGSRRQPVGLTDFKGRPLDGLYFSSKRGFYEGAKNLRARGIRILESDIHPDDRFLMERFIFRGVGVSGGPPPQEWESQGTSFSVFRPDKIEPAEFSPDFRIMSLDIETGTGGEVYCCGFHLSGRGKESRTVLMLDPDSSGERGEDTGLAGGDVFRIRYISDEKSLLTETERYIRESDPDIIIGWNVIGFDLAFLEDRFRTFGLSFGIGKTGRRCRVVRKRSGLYQAEIPGRVVIDGPVSLRSGFHSFEDYRLETVARELLGEGKVIDGHAEADEKIAEIEDQFKNDKKALACYNIMDCVLVSRIFKKTGLIEQLTTRSRLTGLRMDRVNQSVAAYDFYMLPRVHRHGYAAPDVADVVPGNHAAGGLVFTSEAGLYENIMVFDFLSLYPSIIRTFKIDPLARITAERFPETPSYDTPPGIRFSADTNILPERIAELMETRAQAKKAGDAPLSQAVKILMNSFYGVMGTTGCRFYHSDLPTAITGTGQWILKATAEYIRQKGLRVIYGDTDSVFVELGSSDRKIGDRLAAGINEYFEKRLKREFGVDSRLVLEVEKLYDRFFLPPMRGSTEGSCKRYAGLIRSEWEGREPKIEIKGLEYVRSDWTELAKEFQMELFRRFFMDEEIPQWIQSRVEAIRRGDWDEKLVYKRRLTKPAEEYVKNVPPHVKAVRLLDPEGRRRIRRIKYVMTLRGPVPLAMEHRDLDYNHYIEKQIQPLADAVLLFLGTSFTELMEGRQGELF